MILESLLNIELSCINPARLIVTMSMLMVVLEENIGWNTILTEIRKGLLSY